MSTGSNTSVRGHMTPNFETLIEVEAIRTANIEKITDSESLT